MRSTRVEREREIIIIICESPTQPLPTPFPTIPHHMYPTPACAASLSYPSCPTTSYPRTSPPTMTQTRMSRWSTVYDALGVAPISFAEIPPACTLFSSWTLRCTWLRPNWTCRWRPISSRSCHFSSPSTTLRCLLTKHGSARLVRWRRWGRCSGRTWSTFLQPWQSFTFCLSWIRAYVEFALLYVANLTYYV